MDLLLVDEDDKDNQFKDPTTQKIRHHNDEDPSADAYKYTKKRRRKYSERSKKGQDQAGLSKKGKAPSKSSKINKAMDAEETIQDDAMDAKEFIEDDFVENQDPTH
ncbi:hypothetical protein Tco_0476863, partial [Tanacetum coccineum]